MIHAAIDAVTESPQPTSNLVYTEIDSHQLKRGHGKERLRKSCAVAHVQGPLRQLVLRLNNPANANDSQRMALELRA